MRIAFAAGLLAVACFSASPAAATQGQSCRVLSGTGPSIGIVIGSTGIAGASLTEGGATRNTMAADPPLAIAQAWIDEQRLWIDLTDPNHMRSEGRLRLAWTGRGRGRHLAGTFVRGGRLYRLRCEES
jgi:hypothetical protein